MVKNGLGHKALNIKQPKLSIITVVLNGSRFINGYLENVLPFLNDDIELVIIDGGSTDETLNALQQHDALIDYWLSEPDHGIYDAMNKGIKKAKGQWLYFLGIDDRLQPDFTVMLAHLKDKSTIYYGKVLSYGRLAAQVYDAYFLTKLNFCHQAMFYPRAVFDRYRYNTQYEVYADYHLNLQCWKDPDLHFEFHDLLVASFPGGGFSTYTRDHHFERDRDQLFKNYLGQRAYYHYVFRTKGLLHMLKRMVTNA